MMHEKINYLSRLMLHTNSWHQDLGIIQNRSGMLAIRTAINTQPIKFNRCTHCFLVFSLFG